MNITPCPICQALAADGALCRSCKGPQRSGKKRHNDGFTVSKQRSRRPMDNKIADEVTRCGEGTRTRTLLPGPRPHPPGFMNSPPPMKAESSAEAIARGVKVKRVALPGLRGDGGLLEAETGVKWGKLR